MDQHFHESNLIEGYDDPAFDAQQRHAWDYLCSRESITEGDIKKVQKIVTLKQTDLQPDWRGYYRVIGVRIGGRVALAPNLVPNAMKQWTGRLRNANLLVDPIALHIEFERIHPFVDGNGRTGRLLLWWHQQKRGEKPTLFLNSEKHQKYYPLFG